jgi:hypothetical protein
MFSQYAPVDLLVIQLKAAIRRLLDAKAVRGRVLDKVNGYGEVVIGVILERPSPVIPEPPDERHERTHRDADETGDDGEEIAGRGGAR